MNNTMVYIYESAIVMGVLFLFYRLLLRKETYFQINRFFLLGTAFIACIIPLLQLQPFASEGSSLGILARMTSAVHIPEISINGKPGQLNQSSTLEWIIIMIYLAGATFFILRMILGMVKVASLKAKGKQVNFDSYSIVYVNQEIAPFSFFSTIFLNNKQIESSHESLIINHELIHIRQLHTYDRLFIELLKAILWFNPIIWFISAALRNTHEYQADQGVLDIHAKRSEYQAILLNSFKGAFSISLTNSFNSNIKKRIVMMCKNKSSVLSRSKILLLFPVLTFLFLMIACDDNGTELLKENDSEVSAKKADSPDVEDLYYVVDEMPTFNGGDPAVEFRKYIANNLKYPEIAAKNGISGRVIIQFTVDKKGKIADAVVVRSVDPALDNEALRVTLTSPNWTPGKQRGKKVNVLYTFPINFTLQ
jgi:TonB family protein